MDKLLFNFLKEKGKHFIYKDDRPVMHDPRVPVDFLQTYAELYHKTITEQKPAPVAPPIEIPQGEQILNGISKLLELAEPKSLIDDKLPTNNPRESWAEKAADAHEKEESERVCDACEGSGLIPGPLGLTFCGRCKFSPKP